MNGNKAKARICWEQDVNFALTTVKLELLGELYDEVQLKTERRHQCYKAIEVRILLKDSVPFRK